MGEQRRAWMRSDGVMLVVATAVAGGAGYGLTILAHAELPAEGFVVFASFWSILFLVVAGLAGVQQEVGRATGRPSGGSARDARAIVRDVTMSIACGTLLAVLASSPWWGTLVWPTDTALLVAALAVGAASYVGVAALSGTLYGVSALRLVAIMIVFDGLLRLVLTGAALMVSDDPALFGWAVVMPFMVVPLVLLGRLRAALRQGFSVDVHRLALGWNIARTALAASAIGAVVSALPLLISVLGTGERAETVSGLQFVSQMTRAPLIVVALALQTLLVVRLRAGSGVARRTLALAFLVIVAGAVLGFAAAFAGPSVGEAMGVTSQLRGWVYGGFVVSAGVTAALVITGAALLATGRHAAYAAGWVVAASTQVACLATPGSLVQRVMLAVFVGPVAGLVVHGALALRAHSPSAGVPEQRPQSSTVAPE